MPAMTILHFPFSRPLSPALTNPDLLLPADDNDDDDDDAAAASHAAAPVFERPPSPSQIIRKVSSQASLASKHAPRSHRLNWAASPEPLLAAAAVVQVRPTRTPPLSRKSSTLDDIDEHATPRRPAFRDGPEQQQQPDDALNPAGANGRVPPPEPSARRWSETSSSVKSDDFESLESIKWPGFDGHTVHAPEEDDESLVLDDDDDDDGGGDEADDEERFGSFPQSQKSSEAEGDGSGRGGGGGGGGSGSRRTASESDDSAALSRRADIILANAKKRLHLFEGNLRGARHSLPISQSMSMVSLRSPPDLAPPPTPPRDRSRYSGLAGPVSTGMLSANATPGHTRGFSDVSASSFIQQLAAARNQRLRDVQQRSVSALAHHTATQNKLLRSSKSQEMMRDSRVRTWVDGVEDTSAPAPLDSEPPTARNSIRRSPSTTNDLRAQMNELKGKISNLQQRAKEDRRKRASLSSSRAGSPFAESEPANHGIGRYHHVTSSTSFHSLRESRLPRFTGSGARTNGVRSAHGDMRYGSPASNYAESHYEDADELQDERPSSPDPQSMMDKAFPDFDEADAEEEQEGEGEDEYDEYESSDGESAYESVVEEPSQNVAHEDRPDAFDYEHFILHSAMGSYRRGSTSSESSNDSVETTKPISANNSSSSPAAPRSTAIEDSDSSSDGDGGAANNNNPDGKETPPLAERPELHRRHSSLDSVSSMATFMTAEEDSRDPDLQPDDDGLDPLDRALSPLASPPASASTHTLVAPRDSAVGLLSPKRSPSPLASLASVPAASSDGVGALEEPTLLLLSRSGVSVAGRPVELPDPDRALVAALGRSLERACRALQRQERGGYDGKVWRRRLDEARRVLDGVVEGGEVVGGEDGDEDWDEESF